MKIKITPLDFRQSHLAGIFKIRNYYYLAQFHSAGIVTEIRSDDDWLEQEMSWVTRSEIPFVTAMRHAQLEEPHLVAGALTPIVRRFKPFYVVKSVQTFPAAEECMQLVYKYCEVASDGPYHFYEGTTDVISVHKLFDRFDYDNDFLVRAGACLYKAYILLGCSHTFAEEIYVNTFIAFEAMIEYMISRGRRVREMSRNDVVNVISDYLKAKEPGVDFTEYEAEMRDGIRNNIIHPFRRHTGERVAQPFLMADYIFEDLALVDWLFKKIIEGELS